MNQLFQFIVLKNELLHYPSVLFEYNYNIKRILITYKINEIKK